MEKISQGAWQLAMAESPISKFKLQDHQEEAIGKLDSGKILCGGVGTGKTYTALGYYFINEAPKDIYVITTAKKRDSYDWEESAVKFGISTEPGVGFAGKLTVDSWNNIGKYIGVRDGFFIFDEQRLVGTGKWTKSFLAIAKHNRWILLSATPGDTWLDYAPVLIANGHYKNITEFKREHVVYSPYHKFPKVDRYIGERRLARLTAALLIDMPYERHTVRHTHILKVDYDEINMEKVLKRRWNVFENRPLRDVSELFSVMRKLVNTDASRLDTLRSLMNKHPKLIVFYNHNPELEILRSLAGDWTTDNGYGEKFVPTVIDGSTVEVAEWNGHKHQEIPKSDRWVYLVQYQSGAEGWNCIETDTMVFYTLTYSYKLWHQAHGRIDRLNTPYKDLHYYVLKSTSYFDTMVWKALRSKRNFNERELVL